MQLSLDVPSIRAVSEPRSSTRERWIGRRRARRQTAQAAPRLDGRAGDGLCIRLKGSEALKVVWLQGATGGYRAGVLAWQPEGDPRLRVSEHAGPHRRVKLVQVLVGERKANTEAARLGEHIREVQWQVQIVLKLIDVDKDRMAARGRDGGAAEHGLPELRDNKTAQERRGLRAEQAPVQVDEQDFPLYEDAA